MREKRIAIVGDLLISPAIAKTLLDKKVEVISAEHAKQIHHRNTSIPIINYMRGQEKIFTSGNTYTGRASSMLIDKAMKKRRKAAKAAKKARRRNRK